MALFNRKKDESVLPEVDQYYQGERRDRTWLAWVLAIVSIAVVVLILVGLFFAGKWAYNAVTDDSDDVAITNDEDSDLPSFDGNTDEDGQTQGESDDQTEDESSDEAAEGSVEAPAQTTIPSGQSSETPRTGASSDLPNTGPASLVTTFLVTSGVAGTTHYIVSRKRK